MYIQLTQNVEGWSLFWVITERDKGVFSFKFICNKFKFVDWECDVYSVKSECRWVVLILGHYRKGYGGF